MKTISTATYLESLIIIEDHLLLWTIPPPMAPAWGGLKEGDRFQLHTQAFKPTAEPGRGQTNPFTGQSAAKEKNNGFKPLTLGYLC